MFLRELLETLGVNRSAGCKGDSKKNGNGGSNLHIFFLNFNGVTKVLQDAIFAVVSGDKVLHIETR